MAGNIFISYRREDAAGSAALIYESLSREFGEPNVFMDVDNVMAGQRFDQQLEKALAECEVFLAVIGPRWLDLLKTKQTTGERDYVREEITAALQGGVVVIPVTVDHGRLPQEKELPPEIQSLVFHQRHIISQEQRRRDIEALVEAVRTNRKSAPPKLGRGPWTRMALGAGVVVVAAWASAHYAGAPVPWPLSTSNPVSEETLHTLAAIAGTGQSFRDDRADGHLCPLCPEMVVVPAGSFTMGSPADEPERRSDEVQVPITIARPFAVGKFAVTFAEWDTCADDGGCKGLHPKDGGWGRGARPVINVSYEDAQNYIDWLGHRTGKTYRLLSEAEREYVTRAGTTTPFWWGPSVTSSQANFRATKTVAVNSFTANPWGLYNVHGNVSEWTGDCWSDTNSNNPGDGSSRTRGDCGRRTVRGGSWINGPEQLRAAARDRRAPSTGYDDVGFRVAETLVQ